MHRIFVYGTLKRGFPNYSIMPNQARFVGAFRTTKAYPLIIGGKWFVPYLIDEPGQGHQIKGEIFDVDDSGLIVLDKLENVGLPGGYHRSEIAVETCAGNQVGQAWIYLMERAKISIIRDSDYLDEYPHDARYVVPSMRRASF